jgi:hypothetical protein
LFFDFKPVLLINFPTLPAAGKPQTPEWGLQDAVCEFSNYIRYYNNWTLKPPFGGLRVNIILTCIISNIKIKVFNSC